MAQEAKMISQADVVESLAAEGLVSVSEGAGQPQKNMELNKFADSLGSAVPLQQTSEQVTMTGLYARTSDGKMVELTKESVASVIGNLLYGATTKEALASVVAGIMGVEVHHNGIAAGGSLTKTFIGEYRGLFCITNTSYVGYSLFLVRGYGNGSSRNSVVPLTTDGITDAFEFSFFDSSIGFLVKNNLTTNVSFNLLLF